MSAPSFVIDEIQIYERKTVFRLPFRFGASTLTEAPQAFVRVCIRNSQGQQSVGGAAELLAPKWFDKNPDLSHEDNFNQLRLALNLASNAYVNPRPSTAFGHFSRHYQSHLEQSARSNLPALVANLGPALVDRAVIDALCRLQGISFYDAVNGNAFGLNPSQLLGDDEFAHFDMDSFLASLTAQSHIDLRHTIGLVDTLQGQPNQLNDGLPESLEQVVNWHKPRWFKIKLGGNVDDDLNRLQSIASVVDESGIDYQVTIDGNEQFDSIETVCELYRRMQQTRALSNLVSRLALVEQPLSRDDAQNTDVTELARLVPVIVDESDALLSSFVHFKELGYGGVSSKGCKGIYKSFINAARCRMWNADHQRNYILSAEDLSTQAGLAVQQDLALANILGVTHVERNGHYYGRGMHDASAREQQAFLDAHPDLYKGTDSGVTVNPNNGRLALTSLACPGFASAAEPDWTSCDLVSAHHR